MKALFLRVVEEQDKADALRQAISDRYSGVQFEVDPQSFESVPRAPFAYWATERMRVLFETLSSLESSSSGTKATKGLATTNDVRFVRAWWELTPAPALQQAERWCAFAKGGKFSPFYADVYLCVRWTREGAELKAYLDGKIGADGEWSRWINAVPYYFRPGLTWSRRTQAGLSLRALPRGCIFADKGPAAFLEDDSSAGILALLAVTNSRPFSALVELQMAFGSYEVGVLQNTPVPRLEGDARDRLAALADGAWSLKRSLDTQTETSHAFFLPALLQVSGETLAARVVRWAEHVAKADLALTRIQGEIDCVCFDLYDLSDEDRLRIQQGFRSRTTGEVTGPVDDDELEAAPQTELDATIQVASLLSWAVGVAFGRFDLRCATGERLAPPEPGAFDPLPVCSPGMLTGHNGLPLDVPPAGHAIDYPRDGILVDDAGAASDLLALTRQVFERIFDDPAARWAEAADILGDRDGGLRGWFAREFFELHVKRYSMTRRKAPICWQLATPTAYYSAWIYYHRSTRDTLFRLLNDYVKPKLQHEERKLTSLTQDAGPSPSPGQRREIDTQEQFVAELRAFRDEVARVAPLWNPDLNDGVIINFAPLWRLVRHSGSWQKECKKVWDKLVAGEYDWAHLAMRLWPERVVRRCAEDRSLAVAHGLEQVFWEEDDGKWTSRRVSRDVVDRLIEDRTSVAVKSAVEYLLATPTPTASSRGRRGWRRGRHSVSSRKAAASRRDVRAAGSTADNGARDAVREAIAAAGDGATKSEVVKATGISNLDWNAAIDALLAEGVVTRTGTARGTRYHPAEKGGST